MKAQRLGIALAMLLSACTSNIDLPRKEDFEVALNGELWVATHPKLPALHAELECLPASEPKILEVRSVPQHKELILLIYEAGVGGTLRRVKVERAAVIDRKDQRLIFDEIWKREVLSGASNEVAQPEWSFDERGIVVKNSSKRPEYRFKYISN